VLLEYPVRAHQASDLDGRDDRSATELDRADWSLYAACVGEPLELFFPETGISAARALAICATRRVREECLEAAVIEEAQDARPFGVRGGRTAKQRRRDRVRVRAGS
jgi:WhiB family redox-sensing transcriptional regulator